MMAGLAVELLVREWRQRPGRFLLTVGSVSIGTAAVFGALLASASARQAYQEMSRSLEGPPALEIVNEFGGRFAEPALPGVSEMPGIEAIVPLIFRSSLVRVHDRRAKLVVVGTRLEHPEIQQRLPLQSGTIPTGSDQALLSVPLADALQVQVGDSISLLTRRGFRKLRVVGLVQRQPLAQLAGGAGVVLPLTAVQELFGLRGQIDRLRLELASTASREAIKATLSSQIASPLAIQLPQGRIRLAEEVMRSADLALQMACSMAMAMAAFIVLNTVRMNVSERRKQLSTLRCVGASARQVVSLIIIEALVAGGVGSCVGVPLGYGVGWVLVRGMERILQTHIPALTPSVGAVLIPLISGPLLAVLAAWIPARQTRHISPLEGFEAEESTAYDRLPWRGVFTGALLWLVGGTCVVGVIQRWLSPIAAIPAAMVMLVAYVLWLPTLVAPILRSGAWLVRGRLQLAAQLGSEQLLRRRSRTALTAGVVVVALHSSIGLGHGILNNVQDIRDWYHRAFSGDFFLQPLTSLTSSTPGAEDPLREAIAEVAGVTVIDAIRMLPGRAGEQPVICVIRDFPTEVPLPLQLIQTSENQARTALSEGQAVVGTVLARRLNLHRGDSFLVEMNGRSQRLQVGSLAGEYFQGGLVIFLERRACQKRFDTGLPDLYSVGVNPSVREDVQPQLQAIARQYQAGFFSNQEGRELFDRKINGIVGALWSVVGLTFVASGLGIANTLSVNVLEQTRELGLMRIVGMTTHQLRWLILMEAWLLGGLGIVLGLAGGLGAAYLTHLCNEPILGHSPPFAWHHELLVGSVLASLALVSLGAWIPGYRAARLNLLAAIAYE